MQTVYIGKGIHRDGAKAQLFAGPDNPDSDLSSVSDKDFGKVCCLNSEAVASRVPCGSASSQRQCMSPRATEASRSGASFAAQTVCTQSRLLDRRAKTTSGALSR